MRSRFTRIPKVHDMVWQGIPHTRDDPDLRGSLRL